MSEDRCGGCELRDNDSQRCLDCPDRAAGEAPAVVQPIVRLGDAGMPPPVWDGPAVAAPAQEASLRNAILVDWKMEPVKPEEALALMDAIDAEYEKTKGKPAPDAEMARSMSKVQMMLFSLWAAQRETIRAALAALAAPPAPAGEAVRWLQPDDLAALRRFYETCEDNQPYDVDADQMKRLAELGAANFEGRSRYSVTAFGGWLLDLLPEDWPRLPLKTHADHDAYSREQFAALSTNKDGHD
ncbi:hypothetical protein [uncultured Ramlibacter sp.]|uniref:hypothetical protein n=1 Tax=uncultured Ramlibacter sp. TaxID=260755 RepID=UPI0026348C7C|nr:hypothetical protein [uncultured Ramlibacter sp.]